MWSVDESAEEMRRLASLLLKLAASDSTNAPWRPFDGLFVALSIPARSPAPARVMLVIQNTSSRAAGFFLHFQGLESFEVADCWHLLLPSQQVWHECGPRKLTNC